MHYFCNALPPNTGNSIQNTPVPSLTLSISHDRLSLLLLGEKEGQHKYLSLHTTSVLFKYN